MTPEQIVLTLRQARGERTIDALADVMQLRWTQLRAWEAGTREPTVSDLTLWAWALRHNIALTAPDGQITAGTELFGLLSPDAARRAARVLLGDVRHERRRRRLAKIVVAEKIGVTPERLATWERANPAPPLGRFVQLAAVYDLNVAVLPHKPSAGFGGLGWHRHTPTTPWSRFFPGSAEQTQVAEAFVRSVAEEHRRLEDAAFVASTLARHAIANTPSGAGGYFIVRIEGSVDGTLTLTVLDFGTPDQNDYFSVLSALADTWGVRYDPMGRATWAQFT